MPLVYRGDTPPTMKTGQEGEGDSRPLRVPWRRSGARPLRRTVSGSTVKHSSRRSTQKSLFQRASRSSPGGRAASNSRKLDTYGGTSVNFVCRSNRVLPRQYQDQTQCRCVLRRCTPSDIQVSIPFFCICKPSSEHVISCRCLRGGASDTGYVRIAQGEKREK